MGNQNRKQGDTPPAASDKSSHKRDKNAPGTSASPSGPSGAAAYLQQEDQQPTVSTPPSAPQPPAQPSVPPASLAPAPAPQVVAPLQVAPPAPSISSPSEMRPAMEMMPAAHTLVQQLIENARGADQQFYLVILPEDASPRVETFAGVESLQARIMELLGTEVSLFPFMGYWLGITHGENRFLHTPFGVLPLFELPVPDESAIDNTGWVGTESRDLDIPPHPAAAVATTDDAGDGDGDEGEGVTDDDETPVLMQP